MGRVNELKSMYREFYANGGTEAEARRVLGTGTDANGNEYYYRRAGAEPGKVYVDPKLRAKTSGAEARKANIPPQTHGKPTFKPTVAERRSGEYEPQPTTKTRATTLKDHHIRPPGIYETFFNGLTPPEQAELARYAAEDLLEPLGDSKYNRARIPGIAHDGVREEPGGYHEWDRKYKGGELRPQGNNKYTIPQSAKLGQRKELLRQFLGSEQGKMNQALFTEVMANRHPNSEYWQRRAVVLRTHKPNVNPDLPFDSERPKGMLPPEQGPTPKLKPKPSRGLEVSPAKALRIARMGALGPLSLGLGATTMGLSAKAAWEDPTANNIEDAAWDTVNFTADALSLIPILAAPMEGAQKLLGWGHLSRMATRNLNAEQEASMYKNGGYTAD